MPDLNKANREVCDVDIRILRTMAPFLKFNTANTTTAGLSSDSVYAMAKGTRRIAFQNPMEGSMTIEAQVYPFKFFALLTNGDIETSGAYADTQTITASANGSLAISGGANGTIQADSVFVYPEGSFGDEEALIAGTFSSGTFTATNSSDIALGSRYEVGYVVTRSAGIKKITFTNKKLPRDYYITMRTLDKDDQGVLTPFLITAYKATIQRSFELSFSSTGDPASVTMTFDLMEDKDGNIMDMIELTGDVNAMSVGTRNLTVKQGAVSPEVHIYDPEGAVTYAITDSSDNTYSKIHAVVSGDNDTIIISADADAAVGAYTVTLSDSASPAQTAEITVNVVTSE